jgi:hypothetical protein
MAAACVWAGVGASKQLMLPATGMCRSAVLREVGEDFVRDWTAEFTKGWTASKTLAEAIQEEDSRGGLDRRSASRSASQSRRRGA